MIEPLPFSRQRSRLMPDARMPLTRPSRATREAADRTVAVVVVALCVLIAAGVFLGWSLP